MCACVCDWRVLLRETNSNYGEEVGLAATVAASGRDYNAAPAALGRCGRGGGDPKVDLVLRRPIYPLW